MKKYFGWIFALLASFTLTTAFAADSAKEEKDVDLLEEDQVTVVIDLDEITEDVD